MRSAIRNVLATAAVVLLATSAFAALSPEYVQFGKGPAQYFMTPDELAKWKTISTDADAKAFIDLFWMRRDPTPATPANEFKSNFDQLVKLADEKFGFRRTPGSMTDRGKTLIILTTPTETIKQERIPGAAQDLSSSEQTSTGGPITPPVATGFRQTWTYEPAKMPKLLGNALGTATITFVFVDPSGVGDFRFDRARESNAILDKVAQVYLTQPNLTAVTQQTTTTTTTKTTTVTKPAAGAVMTQLKTPAFQAAVDQVKAGKNELAKGSAISYAEMVSPTGDYYVPLSLYIPKSAGLTTDAADTFFGVVEDANGTPVFAFEDPQKLSLTPASARQAAATPTPEPHDLFMDKTLNLPTGKYNAIVGVAKAGQPLIVASKELDLTSVSKEATGTSKMVLSNEIYEKTEAAPVKSPFAFGKLKIVPKGDLVFGPKDELSYFVELHNPGIDATTNLPKMQAKLELSGGKLTKPITAPLSDAPALPLSGTPGPGQYAIISSIPLGEMTKPLPPGDYVLKMRLIDTLTKQTYNLERSFKIQ